MTYMKPEMEIEKFDLIEEITAPDASAAAGGNENGSDVEVTSDISAQSIGGDLVIG